MLAETDPDRQHPSMTSNHVLSLGPHGFHRIHYTQWGDAHNPNVVVCVHGLTRNCRDFDELAAVWSKSHRVICPDMPGRGGSDWLAHKEDYNSATYMADIAALLARLNVERVGWVGTSMGGWIGMLLAAQPNSPISRLLLNDIGPEVSRKAQDRITQYVGSKRTFQDLDSAERYFRNIHAPFGPLTDRQWRHLTETSLRRRSADSEYFLHYDPGIAEFYRRNKNALGSIWDVWDKINCPVHIVRGGDSDLLAPETAAEMQRRGPDSCLTEFPGIGHAPALMSNDQIEPVIAWFAER